jgi:hypothetical protein
MAHLPALEIVQKLVCDNHCCSKRITDGQESQVDPALAGVPSTCLACTRGEMTVKQIGEEQSESDLGRKTDNLNEEVQAVVVRLEDRSAV